MIRIRAFTIVELLLATALWGVLMMGVMGVISRLGGGALASGTRPNPLIQDDALESCARLFRDDLRHADEVGVSGPNQLTLVGPLALDGHSCDRSDRPARVVYSVKPIGSRSWLIREQAPLDVLTNARSRRDLVCSGLVRFEILSQPIALDDGAPQPPRQAGSSERRAPSPTRREVPKAPVPPRAKTFDYRIDNGLAVQVTEQTPQTSQAHTTAAAPNAAPPEPPAEPQDSELQATATSWRLRLWTQEADKPAIDRFLFIR